MLKIYIQIFGTVALVAILLINYNFFYRTPAMEDVAAKQKQIDTLNAQVAVMDSIIVHEAKMGPVEAQIDKDREILKLELPTTYSEPDRVKRIYDLILSAGLDYSGIGSQAVLAASPGKVKVIDFISRPNEATAFQASIASFQEAMAALEGKIPQFQNAETPMGRWAFYDTVSKGVDLKKTKLNQGFERHRYKLTLTGTYANIKKFLWLVNNDKPILQATSVRITPQTGVGETRPFKLDVTIIAYADRNTVFEQLNADPSAFLNAKAPAAEADEADTAPSE